MKKIRWGILSSANIAQKKLMPAIVRAHNSELYAICSRTPSTAKKVAAEFSINHVYESYQALLDDPNVDAIYNPLPNHLHVDWSLKALAAGKHVLCEKPLGLDEKDAQRLVDVATSQTELKVMEAFMYRFHPQWQALKKLVAEGELGQIRTIHSHFSYNNRDENNIRNIKAMGGGALLDIGCYCISLSRFLFGEEPSRVIGLATDFKGEEVDCLTSGILQFSQGQATFSCSTKIEPRQYIEIYGEKGSATIEVPFNPPLDTPSRIFTRINDQNSVIELEPLDQYQLMVESFSHTILNDLPVATPLSDAIANMRVIDAIFASLEEQSWVKIGV